MQPDTSDHPIRNRRGKWIVGGSSATEADLRLFCFPYAGGGASAYRSWDSSLPATIDLYRVQLPGRENRITESPLAEIGLLAKGLVGELACLLDKPFAFFGHSMGSQIAFELAKLIKNRFGLEPAHLFVSGCHAPHLNSPRPAVHKMAEQEFIGAIKNYGGTPADVFANRELQELILPMLRTDFLAAETYRTESDDLLSCPMTAFCGTEDYRYHEDVIKPWHRHTTGAFNFEMINGDHFFIKSAEQRVIRKLLEALPSAGYGGFQLGQTFSSLAAVSKP